MANPTAPYFDNVRWPGADGLRVPQEAGSATLAVTSYQSTAAQSGSSLTLNAIQMNASVLFIGSMSSTTNNTVSLPAAIPGAVFLFKNNSGSACTFKVSGATGVSVANGSHAILACNSTDIEQFGASF